MTERLSDSERNLRKGVGRAVCWLRGHRPVEVVKQTIGREGGKQVIVTRRECERCGQVSWPTEARSV